MAQWLPAVCSPKLKLQYEAPQWPSKLPLTQVTFHLDVIWFPCLTYLTALYLVFASWIFFFYLYSWKYYFYRLFSNILHLLISNFHGYERRFWKASYRKCRYIYHLLSLNFISFLDLFATIFLSCCKLSACSYEFTCSWLLYSNSKDSFLLQI